MAAEISGLDNVIMYDMVKLECDDIKKGLMDCANGFSDLLLDNLVTTHMEDNQRCVLCVCVLCVYVCVVCVCVHACVRVCAFCMHAIINMVSFAELYVTTFHSKPDHLQSQATPKR